MHRTPRQAPYGASPGVPGSDGGGGKLIRVGALLAIVVGCKFGSMAVFCEMEEFTRCDGSPDKGSSPSSPVHGANRRHWPQNMQVRPGKIVALGG